MKNLKRALSLVLSAAMMVGMMVVGTGAAFTDVAESDHKEAIEVMTMVGIMKGVSETEFAPEADVTRDQMAVIMCNLLDLKLNGTHPFTDVADWADKYVGAIYINGYTSGKSATTYGGSDKITTAEAALMIMKTLGYFEYQGEFGEDWLMATVKRATELQLFKDIDAGVKETLTRGEVAQMVLNALDEDMVLIEERGGMNVTGDGFSVSEKAYYLVDKIECDEKGHNHYVDLAEKLYGTTLADIETVDAFGRPAVKWTYTGAGKDQSVTVADEPTVVFTAKTNKDDVTKALKEYELVTVTGSYKDDEGKEHEYTIGANYWVDGVQKADVLSKIELYERDGKDSDGKDIKIAGKTANGLTIEVYTNEDLEITDIIAVNEYVGKVTKINKADEASATKRSVVIDYKSGLTFETEDFAKDDMVIYTIADGKIKSMAEAEYVEGKVTASTGTYVKIDGVTYKYNHNYTDAPELDADVKIYVDSNGYLIHNGKVDPAAPVLTDFVIVTAVGSDGFGEKNAIKVLKTDGTTEVVGIEVKDNSLATVEAGTMYIMKDSDADGKAEFKEPEKTDGDDADEKIAGFDKFDASSVDTKNDNLANGWAIADDAVVFVQKLDADGKAKAEWTVATGAALAASKNADKVLGAYANKNDNGFYTAELLYAQSAMKSASDIVYGYVTADVELVKNADGDIVNSVTFWDGEEYVTLLTDKDNAGELAKKAFFSYKISSDNVLTDVEIVASTGAIAAFDGKNMSFYGKFVKDAEGKDTTVLAKYEVNEDTKIVYVDVEEVEGVEDGAISLAEEILDNEGKKTGTYYQNVVFGVDETEKTVTFLIVDVQNDIQDKM